jgi:hypothetical protein
LAGAWSFCCWLFGSRGIAEGESRGCIEALSCAVGGAGGIRWVDKTVFSHKSGGCEIAGGMNVWVELVAIFLLICCGVEGCTLVRRMVKSGYSGSVQRDYVQLNWWALDPDGWSRFPYPYLAVSETAACQEHLKFRSHRPTDIRATIFICSAGCSSSNPTLVVLHSSFAFVSTLLSLWNSLKLLFSMYFQHDTLPFTYPQYSVLLQND